MQNIEPRGLDISCMCKRPLGDSGGSLWHGRERRVHELGAVERGICERDQFSRRIRISSPLGSISAVRAGNHQWTVVGACGLREREALTSWGPWSPMRVRGTCLAGGSEYRAQGARYQRYVQETTSRWWWEPMGCGREGH